jgi:DNA-binding FadR family transcriptional regulator
MRHTQSGHPVALEGRAIRIGDEYPPIGCSSVAERVAGRLLELVRTKSLKPGDLLPTERELSATMQVSRPTVREAVRGLQILGVLKVRHGISVSSLDASDLLGPRQFLITRNTSNVHAPYKAAALAMALHMRNVCNSTYVATEMAR